MSDFGFTMPHPSMRRKGYIDYTNHRLACGLVLREVGKNPYGTVVWRVICEHGVEFDVISGNLKNKKCCPCNVISSMAKNLRRHSHTFQTDKGADCTPEYAAWQQMKDRCKNPKSAQWKNYGGRGIKVCQRWLDSFDNFIADMGARLSPKHSLDRFPNMNGNYEPSNCRWATWKEQRNNSRQNRFVTFRGKKATVMQHLEEMNMVYARRYVYSRLATGWLTDDAFLLPKGSRKPKPAVTAS